MKNYDIWGRPNQLAFKEGYILSEEINGFCKELYFLGGMYHVKCTLPNSIEDWETFKHLMTARKYYKRIKLMQI